MKKELGLDITRLEKSFALVAPKGEALVARFYERLFERYPVVKPLFKNVSMDAQRKSLLGALVLTIKHLRKPEKLASVLRQLGQRHVGYGAKPAHYDAVAETLLAVLQEFAGKAWTTSVHRAWKEALGTIKTVMLEGAKTSKPTARTSQKGAIAGRKEGKIGRASCRERV